MTVLYDSISRGLRINHKGIKYYLTGYAHHDHNRYYWQVLTQQKNMTWLKLNHQPQQFTYAKEL